MSIQECLEEIKNIHDNLLIYLENDEDSDDDYNNLIKTIEKQKICTDKQELTLFLRLISKVFKYHHRNSYFINKIERILRYLSNDMKQNLSNSQIFNIFKSNKRILLFLFEEKIIIMTNFIIQTFKSTKYTDEGYQQYFFPEMKSFLGSKWPPKRILFSNSFKTMKCINQLNENLPANFNELRKEGENDSFICNLIRNDSVEEFVAFVNRNNYSLKSFINLSTYETNSFLIQNSINSKKVTLIQYAAFYGSIQILRYLIFNKVELTPQLWNFAIHSKNGEIIHLLEEYEVEKISDKECLNESIKCHHNDFVNYFLDNCFQSDKKSSSDFLINCIKYHNFSFFKIELINNDTFFYLCKYEYYSLISFALKDENIDVNKI